MRFQALILAFAVTSLALPSPALKRGVNDFINQQRERSLQGVEANFGGNSKAPDVNPGIVVASPTKEDPNYYYTWTRDAALTLKMIADEVITGNTGLEHHLQDYVTAQAKLQTVSNPSGGLYTGRGLGEPKYYGNLTRFNDNWGRPQRDGPALRATTLIAYSRYLIGRDGESGKDHVREVIWPIIYNDLQYTGQYWASDGFDLWEEVKGFSFFTTAAQHRALSEGGDLAKTIGVECAACESEAPNVLCRLQQYWNGNYIEANQGYDPNAYQRGNIDANTVLGSLASFDPKSDCTDSTFQPCSPKALQNLKAYVDAFRNTTLYPINENYKSGQVATGRYIEDVYYEGNPWYLTTLAVAEQLYDAVQQYRSLKSLTITSSTLPFWQDLIPDIQEGTYTPDSHPAIPTYSHTQFHTFTDLLYTLIKHADGFVTLAYDNIPADGSMSEQFSKYNTTYPISARDLTWSYASFVTASSARRAALEPDDHLRSTLQVPSWNEAAHNTVPAGACLSSSVKGTYLPAVAAGADPNGAPCTVTTTFNVTSLTVSGENMYVWGNISEVGDYFNPFQMSAGQYAGPPEGTWLADFDLPAGETFEYMYLRDEQAGTWTYDPTVRTRTVAACGAEGAEAQIQDRWAGEGTLPQDISKPRPSPFPQPTKPATA